jgi:alkylation response protein AidB-like acyl-CoA dehydrogenase
MELQLDEGQLSLQGANRAFLEREWNMQLLRDRDGAPSPYERDWWARGADLGWTAMLVPESLGGGSPSGCPIADLAVIAEERAKRVAPGPFQSVNVVLAGLIEGHKERPAHTDLIADLVSGRRIASWAVYEPDQEWDDVRSPRCFAKPTPDGFVLDGVKDRVESVLDSDVFLVAASVDGKLAQFLVPADAIGVTSSATWTIDISRRFGRVRLDQVAVPASALVGEIGDNALFDRQEGVAIAIQCAEMSGCAEAAFGRTVQWAVDRYSFGRPLASYQALKHRFADMKTWLEACHAMTSGVVGAVQHQSTDMAELISAAKGYIGLRASDIAQDCVQLHGGIGVTWEHDMHLWLRRITVNRLLFGTPAHHHGRLADLILRKAGRDYD